MITLDGNYHKEDREKESSKIWVHSLGEDFVALHSITVMSRMKGDLLLADHCTKSIDILKCDMYWPSQSENVESVAHHHNKDVMLLTTKGIKGSCQWPVIFILCVCSGFLI